MKLNPLYLLLALSLAFVGCDDDDEKETPVAGTAGTEGGMIAGTAGTEGGMTAGTAGTEGGMTAGTAGTEGGMTAGTEGGVIAGTEPPMADCDTSCGAFAQCAVDSCTGYDEGDFEALKSGCMETCTPALAGVFDSKETCEEKIDFVSGVRMDFPALCASTTGGFCETLEATCGPWENTEVSCADWYNAAPAGEEGATEGASQACYEYHLGAAIETMMPEVHCPHARGEMICVDATETPAETFCATLTATCGEWMNMDTSCVDWYNAAPAGEAGATEGASQACYEYHLDAAISTMMPEVHCPHALGEMVCVDATETPAETFCANLTATCGEWMNMETSCVDWYNAAPAGEAGATEGASQACYEYHLGVAMSMEPEVHCPHARGEMVCVDP